MNEPQNELAQAFAQHQAGQLAAAERRYGKLLQTTPNDPDLLYLLAMLYLDTGRAPRSAEFFAQAIKVAESQGRKVEQDWRLAHGSALQRSGRHADALSVFDTVLADDPQSGNGLFGRATALQELGRRQEAVDAYQGLLVQGALGGEAACNMGLALRDLKRPGLATLALRLSVSREPGHAAARRALESLDAGRYRGEAGKTSPEDSALYLLLGQELVKWLLRSSRVEDAETELSALLDRFPDDLVLISQYSLVRLFQGDHAGAREYALKALALRPNFAPAHLNLAVAEGYSGDESRIAQMEELASDENVRRDELGALHFALAGRYGSRDDHKQSMDHYFAGNAIQRAILTEQGFAYDRDAEDRLADWTIANNRREAFAGPGASESELPVFIVGMPRSGTTLVEQILASHSRIAGAGELTDIGRVVARLGYGQPRPNGAELQDIASQYLNRLAKIDPGALRITDKMPTNFRHLWLIARLFPRARVIHCQRHPADTCLSCFMQNFGGNTLSWSFDLGDVVHYYKSYRRVMDHWRGNFPGRFLEIRYEDLVTAQEAQSRRLIEFTGLEWDAACLEFHKSPRAVNTASHSQVRRPIYDTSIGRWRRYGEALAPMLDGLGEFLEDGDR